MNDIFEHGKGDQHGKRRHDDLPEVVGAPDRQQHTGRGNGGIEPDFCEVGEFAVEFGQIAGIEHGSRIVGHGRTGSRTTEAIDTITMATARVANRASSCYEQTKNIRNRGRRCG
jgi:hypothetical protein